MATQNMIERAYSTTPTATTISSWDANKNLSANNHLNGYATTATAAATTTLDVTSAWQQFFTGTTTQTVVLPVASTLVLGQSFYIVNNSTGVVTVQSSGTNTVQAMAASTTLLVTCIKVSGTDATSWSVEYVGAVSGGTVNAGTTGQIAYYAGNGSVVSGENTIAATNLPTGTQFNTQQGQFTTTASSSSASFVDTGITVNITPTSASNTVLVRAVVQCGNDAAATMALQLVRGSTPIGVGTSVGSRDAVGSSPYQSNPTVSMSCVTMEWLDTPATTSLTTYKVQYEREGGSGSVYINRTATDTNSAGFPRTASTITVCEVKV